MKPLKKSIFSAFCIALAMIASTSAVFAERHDGGAFFTFSKDSRLFEAVFFGESTTAHLSARGVLPKERVWANNSCTMRLDSSTATRTVNDPQTGEAIRFREAVERYRPPTVVLSFGLNGIMHFSEKPDEYLANYRKLIEKIRTASPSTEIIVQSVYPVADLPYQAEWRFSISPREINERISALNLRLEDACATLDGTTFANTASAIKDAEGFLRSSYTTDGIHLTAEAYERILSRLEEAV